MTSEQIPAGLAAIEKEMARQHADALASYEGTGTIARSIAGSIQCPDADHVAVGRIDRGSSPARKPDRSQASLWFDPGRWFRARQSSSLAGGTWRHGTRLCRHAQPPDQPCAAFAAID